MQRLLSTVRPKSSVWDLNAKMLGVQTLDEVSRRTKQREISPSTGYQACTLGGIQHASATGRYVRSVTLSFKMPCSESVVGR